MAMAGRNCLQAGFLRTRHAGWEDMVIIGFDGANLPAPTLVRGDFPPPQAGHLMAGPHGLKRRGGGGTTGLPWGQRFWKRQPGGSSASPGTMPSIRAGASCAGWRGGESGRAGRGCRDVGRSAKKLRGGRCSAMRPAYMTNVTDRSFGDDAEVVGDEDDGHAHLPLESLDQGEDLGLDRDIEGGRGLVGDEQLRAAGEGHRDAPPAGACRRKAGGDTRRRGFRARDAEPAASMSTVGAMARPAGRSGAAGGPPASWRPTVWTGLRAVIGSWNTMPIRPPAPVELRPSRQLEEVAVRRRESSPPRIFPCGCGRRRRRRRPARSSRSPTRRRCRPFCDRNLEAHPVDGAHEPVFGVKTGN